VESAGVVALLRRKSSSLEVLMQKGKLTALAVAALFLLSGCDSMEKSSEEWTEWAAGEVNDTLEAVGSGVQEALDNLHKAEYQGGAI